MPVQPITQLLEQADSLSLTLSIESTRNSIETLVYKGMKLGGHIITEGEVMQNLQTPQEILYLHLLDNTGQQKKYFFNLTSNF